MSVRSETVFSGKKIKRISPSGNRNSASQDTIPEFSISFGFLRVVFFPGETPSSKNREFGAQEGFFPVVQFPILEERVLVPAMIDHSPQAISTSPQLNQGSKSLRKVATCFTPWVFMEFRDLFGDRSPEGNFTRLGCIHESGPDGRCLHGNASEQTVCWETRPERQVVHVPSGCTGLPRELIRSILQSGDELILQFEQGSSPAHTSLSETAHILRKLRNTGINVTVSGLSTLDKAKLSRLEWTQP